MGRRKQEKESKELQNRVHKLCVAIMVKSRRTKRFLSQCQVSKSLFVAGDLKWRPGQIRWLRLTEQYEDRRVKVIYQYDVERPELYNAFDYEAAKHVINALEAHMVLETLADI